MNTGFSFCVGTNKFPSTRRVFAVHTEVCVNTSGSLKLRLIPAYTDFPGQTEMRS